MNPTTSCPTCGESLPADAPMGMCPSCLVEAGFGTITAAERPAKSRSFEPPTPEALASRFPNLEILELLGRGGMGAVYKVRQTRLDRVVALKILPPGIGENAAFHQRFEREAKALAKLHHPGIVTLYEFGEADGLYYFLMEYVDGVTLRQLLTGGRLAPQEAVAIVPQICEALQFAHERGIVHRDIKPENILLNKDGQVKIADFGVAKIVGGADSGAAKSDAGAAGSAERTGIDEMIGTPSYMAPEQIERRGDVDHRADIYALGVVFYQMLTGELPSARLQAPSRKVQIDVRLDEVVLRALAREPDRRYQEAGAMKTQVETIAASAAPGSRSKEAWRVYGAALLKLLPLGIAWWLCLVFLVPKLQAMLAVGGVSPGAPNGLPLFVLGIFRADNLWFVLGIFAALGLADWLVPDVRKHRRRALRIASFGLNAVVIVGLLGLATLSLVVGNNGRTSSSPDDRPLYQTGPARGVSSAPFVARYHGGTVELAAIAPHPSAGQAGWRPDGSASPEQWSDSGRSTAAGKEMREIVFKIRSEQGNPSGPLVRFAPLSECVAMGSSTSPQKGDQPQVSINTIGCPPSHQTASFAVGVADGPWETIITLEKGAKLDGYTQIGREDGLWVASVSSVPSEGNGRQTVAFHYSTQEGWETRLAIRTSAGVTPMKTQQLRGTGDLYHGMTTLTAEEVESIQAIELQRRPYQWMEFRNISLRSGFQSGVEVADALPIPPR